MTSDVQFESSSTLNRRAVTKAAAMALAGRVGSIFLLAGPGAEPISISHGCEDRLPTQKDTYEIGKRIFDLSLALILLPMTALFMVFISAAIMLSSGGPVLFRQQRVGRYGRTFTIFKFRTMRQEAERILNEHLSRSAEASAEWNQCHKLHNDPRVTPLGKLLRETSLDELPQILNILMGDMSFVGPRPIVSKEIAMYAGRISYYLAARPGLTGLWQVSGRSGLAYEVRVLLDEAYVRRWTMGADIRILLKTPVAVFRRHGAC